MSPSHHKSWANSCLSLFFSITFADYLAPCWLEWCDDDDNVEVSIWEVFCACIMIHVMCSLRFMCCLCCALVLLYIGLTCHISVQCVCRVLFLSLTFSMCMFYAYYAYMRCVVPWSSCISAWPLPNRINHPPHTCDIHIFQPVLIRMKLIFGCSRPK